MDSNNNRGRRRSSSRNSNSRARRRRRNATNRGTMFRKAKRICSNLLGMVLKRGSTIVVLIVVFGVGAIVFDFLAKATAVTGGFFHGLCALITFLSRFALGIFCTLGLLALLNNYIQSFKGDGIETPDKGLFKKFHQLKYELFEGVNDPPTEASSPRRRRRQSTDNSGTDSQPARRRRRRNN